MIFGVCPHDGCAEPLALPIASGYERHLCGGCGGAIWTRHSRIDPWSMTEADFLATHEVDSVAKTIKPRSGWQR